MVQWFCLISWSLFDIWTPYFGIMSQYDPMFDPKIIVCSYDHYLMVQWFCLISWRLFAVWTSYFRSLWPIFQGPVILPHILKIIWYMNTILLFYESVWPGVWPKINVGHCDLYFMVQWIFLISCKLFSSWTSYFGTVISMTQRLTSKYL